MIMKHVIAWMLVVGMGLVCFGAARVPQHYATKVTDEASAAIQGGGCYAANAMPTQCAFAVEFITCNTNLCVKHVVGGEESWKCSYQTQKYQDNGSPLEYLGYHQATQYESGKDFPFTRRIHCTEALACTCEKNENRDWVCGGYSVLQTGAVDALVLIDGEPCNG